MRGSLQLPIKLNAWVKGDAEGHCRHLVMRTHLEGSDCTEDDAFLAFAGQAVVEAEIRATEARFALDERTTVCLFSSMATAN
jgi:hypothetical protein